MTRADWWLNIIIYQSILRVGLSFFSTKMVGIFVSSGLLIPGKPGCSTTRYFTPDSKRGNNFTLFLLIPVWFVTACTIILKTLETGEEIHTPSCSWGTDGGLYYLQYWGSHPFPHLSPSWCRIFILHGTDQCISVWAPSLSWKVPCFWYPKEHHSFSFILSGEKSLK